MFESIKEPFLYDVFGCSSSTEVLYHKNIFQDYDRLSIIARIA